MKSNKQLSSKTSVSHYFMHDRRLSCDVIPWLPSPNAPCWLPFMHTDTYKRNLLTWMPNHGCTRCVMCCETLYCYMYTSSLP